MTDRPNPSHPPDRPRSLVWATDLDVLAPDRVIERRPGYFVARSPSNPTYYYGNLLLLDDPPAVGDGARWEALFEREFAGIPRIRHRCFGWDRTDGELGRAGEEFVARGYRLEESVGLIATPEQLAEHPRANREVVTRPLGPEPAADQSLWDQVLELQVAARADHHDEAGYREFSVSWLRNTRELIALGRGAWYVALGPAGEQVLGSCGLIVTDARGRFRSVDTLASHRRQGICSRLVVDAARDAARRFGATRLAIVADPDYHALGLYESLGFQRVERVASVNREPPPDG